MSVTTFNSVGGYSTGLTGFTVIDSVGGISAAGSTFSALTAFTSGITTSYIYASTGSTFGSTLRVNGGSTLAGRVDVGGILDVVGGVTLESTLDAGGVARFAGGVTFASTTDHTGVARFAAGVTISGTLNGTTASFTRLLTGTTATFSTTVNTNNITAISTITPLTISGNNGGVRIKEWDYLNANPIIIDTPNPIYIGDYGQIDSGLYMTVDPASATIDTGGMSIIGAGSVSTGTLALTNSEYISNNTNGRMDFMPSPHGSTAFGLYMDMTSWQYGVILGTINSAGQLNTNGYFRFDVPLTINNDTFFQMGSDGQYRFSRTTTGNDTAQFAAYCDGVNNSGAYAIVGFGSDGLANRSPATKHTNPNLYIYANGSASANDFIRFEHDRTNSNIVTGGTSGIYLQPGSGTVGVSGGVSADAFILAGGGIKALTGTTYSFLAADNGKIITMSNAGGITAAIPTGLPVGFSVTVIQLGAGQVGFSADAGVTLNSYNSLKKIIGQHGSASVVIYSSNTANLAGSLT